MPTGLALTPFIAADPVVVGADVASPARLLSALDLPAAGRAGFLALAPRIGLVHALGGADRVVLKWARFSPARPLAAGAGPVDVAVVVTGPWRESATVLRLVGRLAAGLADSALVDRVAAATTREELVRALAPLDRNPAERPLMPAELFALLDSGPGGLAPQEARRRLEVCGPNEIERARRRPPLLRLGEQFVSLFAILLWVGGALAVVAGMPELGWAIFAVIVVNGLFSFLQEHRAERAVEALGALLPREVSVIRDGTERRVPVGTLVPGDVVRLVEGDQVPADGDVLAAAGFRVDQSALTGESHAVLKLPVAADERERVPRLERHELVFAGTAVMAGEATVLLTATGMATEIGAVARLTRAIGDEASPLEREMRRVIRVVTALAVSIGVMFFAISVATALLDPGRALLFALGVIVANVPEGLLPTLTLALAMGVQRMARLGSLVKRLSAVEALGATTVICTDKTGTLTRGVMAVRSVWVSGRLLVPSGSDPSDAGAFGHEALPLLEAASLASLATSTDGDPTETALVAAAGAAGVDVDGLRRARPVLAAYPFDSFRKRMTLVRRAERPVAYVKGAPRETLALCGSVRWGDERRPLTEEVKAAVVRDHDRLASDGLRLLAVAERALTADLVGAPQGAVERDLTLLGLVALWDPPRPEVPAAVAACQRAGIRVVIVTGDYGLTAQAIGRQIGLRADKVVTGEEVERLRPPELSHLVREPGVLFARTSPAHKLAIVEAPKAGGEVVAVTGDGVNDAPALKAAATGVAMGRRGTEVARESADMVITDDNFASIVAAIREGRAVYANIGKFITYIFASNVPELVPFLVFVVFGIPLPLTVMQILAVDLGTDLLPALALGAEPPEPGVMERPPRPHGARLLGAGRLLRAYAFLGVIEAALALGAFFWTYWLAGWRPGLEMAASGDLYQRATTMTLAGIVAAQVGNVFACRTDRESVFRSGLLRNRLIPVGIVVEVTVLVLLIVVPPLRAVFGLAPLRFEEWGILLAFPVVVLALEEGRKWLVRRRRPGP